MNLTCLVRVHLDHNGVHTFALYPADVGDEEDLGEAGVLPAKSGEEVYPLLNFTLHPVY